MKTLLTLITFVLFTNIIYSQDPCIGVVVEEPFICGQNLVDPRDGKIYSTTFLNFQCWMAENLDYDTVGAYYYMNNVSYGVYGRLYNWFTAMSGSPDFDGLPGQVRGICPPGWHIPSNQEFFNIDNFYLPGAGLTGGSMKSTLTDAGVGSWILPNTGATNSTGFSAIPAGRGLPFQQEGNIAYFWTSTGGGDVAYYYYLESYTSELDRFSIDKTTLRSVRCVMDCDFSPLPIKLLWFKATVVDGRSVALEWSTASETDSDLFAIERSDSDAEDWSVVENVSAHGSTSTVSNYTVVDDSPLSGTNYYRLVEVDIFGLMHYYGIVTANFRKKFSLSPNPVTRGGLVILPDGVVFDVYDVVGAYVSSVKERFTANFPSGTYFLFPTEGVRSSPDYTPMVLVVDQ